MFENCQDSSYHDLELRCLFEDLLTIFGSSEIGSKDIDDEEMTDAEEMMVDDEALSAEEFGRIIGA